MPEITIKPGLDFVLKDKEALREFDEAIRTVIGKYNPDSGALYDFVATVTWRRLFRDADDDNVVAFGVFSFEVEEEDKDGKKVTKMITAEVQAKPFSAAMYHPKAGDADLCYIICKPPVKTDEGWVVYALAVPFGGAFSTKTRARIEKSLDMEKHGFDEIPGLKKEVYDPSPFGSKVVDIAFIYRDARGDKRAIGDLTLTERRSRLKARYGHKDVEIKMGSDLPESSGSVKCVIVSEDGDRVYVILESSLQSGVIRRRRPGVDLANLPKIRNLIRAMGLDPKTMTTDDLTRTVEQLQTAPTTKTEADANPLAKVMAKLNMVFNPDDPNWSKAYLEYLSRGKNAGENYLRKKESSGVGENPEDTNEDNGTEGEQPTGDSQPPAENSAPPPEEGTTTE